jgi:hypothetical protein
MRPRLAILAPLFSLAAAAAFAADPVYVALRAARPEGPALSVANLALERDVFRFRFEKGVFQFLAPVEGRVTGAVFVGEGSWELRPALEVERRHLALLRDDPKFEVLSDRFQSLVLLFTDDTESEIRGGATQTGAAPAGAGDAWDSFRRTQRKTLKTNLQIRILGDLLRRSDPKTGVFLAGLDGKKLPEALIAVDPKGLDWLAPNILVGSENSALYVIPEADSGFWYLCRRKAELGTPAISFGTADADHYEIDSTILESTRLRGSATLRLAAVSPGLRVLPLRLMDRLRIQEAELGDGKSWTPLAVVQEKEDEDSEAAVVLPAAMPAGDPLFLRLRYEGKDVLRDRGEGNFAVGARESWYPNLGTFRTLAAFDLTYRVPKGRQVVSVGERLSDRVEGDAQVSVWRTDRPIRVAGFNYGKFRRLETDDKESGLKIEVFTNPGTPDLIQEINLALQARRAQPPQQDLRAPGDSAAWLGPQAGLSSLQLDTEAFAQGAMADGVNAARVGTAYFGKLPGGHVAITQQAQWFFGQSWPSLVFLPYLAVLDGTMRHELGLTGTSDFVDLVGPHELAHQWWGHLVGWESYRDQWLSEGFAEFTAALVLEHASGAKRTADFWEKQRRWILQRTRTASVSNDQAGPIVLGTRLATRQSPAGYQAVVYSKGAYVVHMLRMLMWDARAKPADTAFIAMMHDFASSFAGKNPSTRDFQTVVERHMTPAMDQTHDRKMDWFFRQWVEGTEIPRYAAKVAVSSAAADQYRFTGTVSQEGVSADFRGFLPLYIEFETGEIIRFGVVTLVGNQSTPVEATIRLPKKPKRVIANAMHDVLARD